MPTPSNAKDEYFLEMGQFEEVRDVIDYCLWDGPVRNIPAHDEVRKWREILVLRGPEFAVCVANCDDFLNP